jgi:predicted transcriptional regulator
MITNEQRDILNLLVSWSMNERDMADALGRNVGDLFFDLDELNSLGLVKTRHLFAGLDTWTLTPEGRRYLK